MCGIAGMLDRTGGIIDGVFIKRMCDVMSYRGPNDEGYYMSGNFCMGMRRLSIIDLSTGKQPIHNEDKSIWTILNGEIYNFRELREALEKKGHRFYTKTDTEIIVHLYEEYGEDCMRWLSGMFWFAIWDELKKKLLLARDRIGEKPLYYASVNGKFLFGSEIKCLLQSQDVSKRIDLQSLDSYFSFLYIPAPRTIFEDIRKLPPGHRMMVGQDIRIEQYWELEFWIDRRLDPTYFVDGFQEHFRRSVRERLVSDVPLGALLSGGIDSSAALCVNNVETFTVWGIAGKQLTMIRDFMGDIDIIERGSGLLRHAKNAMLNRRQTSP